MIKLNESTTYFFILSFFFSLIDQVDPTVKSSYDLIKQLTPFFEEIDKDDWFQQVIEGMYMP